MEKQFYIFPKMVFSEMFSLFVWVGVWFFFFFFLRDFCDGFLGLQEQPFLPGNQDRMAVVSAAAKLRLGPALSTRLRALPCLSY